MLASLLAALAACSSEGKKGSAHPPGLSNLSVYPPSAAVNDGGGIVGLGFSVDVSDAGADVNRIVRTVRDASGAKLFEVGEPLTNPPGLTEGTLAGTFPMSTSGVGTWAIELQIFDAAGGSSNVVQATFTVTPGNPVPTLLSMTPTTVTAGSPSFTLTVTGSGFLASSSVTWNGSWLPTTYVSETRLEAVVPSYEMSYARTVSVAVWNPVPGGGTSSSLTFTIDPQPPNPVPTIASVSPTSAEAGGPAFTLTVTGTGFVASSTVQWNGNSLTTTFVDATTLRAAVSTAYLSSVGPVSVTVYNPWPGGGWSSAATFAVTMPPLPGVTAVPVKANDLAWDPFSRKIYLTIPSASPAHQNTIAELDPFTGLLGAAVFAGSEPRKLALSDDGQFAYVALGGASSVVRFRLPDLASELEIPLGTDPSYGAYFARDVQVAPGAPHALAVLLSSSTGWGNTAAVFDDTVARTNRGTGGYGSEGAIQWGATASSLYKTSYSGDLYVHAVDASGVTQTASYYDAFNGSRIHFDAGSGYLYDDFGRAVEPQTGLLKGTFPVRSSSYFWSGAMVPDSTRGSAFFAGSSSSYPPVPLSIRAYHLTQYYETRTKSLPFLQGGVSRVIRWGPDGLALLLPNDVVLVRGTIVLADSPTDNPSPVVSSLSPPDAAAGASNLRVTVTGVGFVPGSIVRWNGSDRSTRFVSATELVAYVPASDLATIGSSQVVVANPSPGGGTSDPLTFTVTP